MSALRAELLKLLRPAMLVAGLGVVGILAMLFAAYQSTAEVQRLSAIRDYEAVAHAAFDPERQCEDLYGVPPGPECERLRDEAIATARRWVVESQSVYPFAHVQQHPLGIGGIVAGHLASLLGALVIGAVSATHIAGEWATGTIKPVLARHGRGMWFVALKFLSTWVAGVLLLVASWGGLAAVSPLLRALYADVHPSPPGFDMWAYAMPKVGRAVIVLGFFAALGTLAAVLTRSPLATFTALLGSVFAFQVGAAFEATVQGTPGYWVSAWMDFQHNGLWAQHLWVDQFPLTSPDPQFQPNPWHGLVGIAAGATLAVVIAWIRMRHSDVRR